MGKELVKLVNSSYPPPPPPNTIVLGAQLNMSAKNGLALTGHYMVTEVVNPCLHRYTRDGSLTGDGNVACCKYERLRWEFNNEVSSAANFSSQLSQSTTLLHLSLGH